MIKFDNALFRDRLWKMGRGAVLKVAQETGLSISTIYKLNSDNYTCELSDINQRKIAKAIGVAKAKLFQS